ncbi:hypothetical protein SKUN_001704 [Spiroplasma kunkelii CR2-3x]|uniref:Uncharacterized protein n=1 Tax=Spiroplasma kunkelii CR2-3x TaxID=273035 RepID=A0A0K2JIZ1_SPIKU|nr:hypothetical protein [Spiroplasma kunkelii]ALA98560.1 hypothetical protein SKUN_001704 [Spiroplasma kunkelii CR2-3x]
MKEIRNLQLSEFQKEIINKLDDEYCYETSVGYEDSITIFNKEQGLLIRINKTDDTASINESLEFCKSRIEKSLNNHNQLVKDEEKRIKLLELILKENK